jgi:hypothetical protein
MWSDIPFYSGMVPFQNFALSLPGRNAQRRSRVTYCVSAASWALAFPGKKDWQRVQYKTWILYLFCKVLASLGWRKRVISSLGEFSSVSELLVFHRAKSCLFSGGYSISTFHLCPCLQTDPTLCWRGQRNREGIYRREMDEWPMDLLEGLWKLPGQESSVLFCRWKVRTRDYVSQDP